MQRSCILQRLEDQAQMTRMGVPIGIAAVRSGVKVPTIRYYEEIGLLTPAARTKSNRRHYDAGDLRRLVFIRRARELGFEIGAIRALLAIQDNPDQSCEGVDTIARARLREIEQRIASLLKLKGELQRMITDCACRRVADCRIIEALVTPNQVGPDDTDNCSGLRSY
jgi:DNA-binding transcriptional MerR regulator